MLDGLVNKENLAFEYPKKKVNHRRVYDDTKAKGYNIVTGKLSFNLPFFAGYFARIKTRR